MRAALTGLLLTAAFLHAAEPLRVMTFNVRYPAESDGANIWDNRKDILVNTIRRHKPDVMGTQELFHMQGEYIVEKLPEYAWFGVSRRGNTTDEHMGVFYRKDRLRLVESGNFWLSETPEKPDTAAWGANLPRMVTWGVFEDTTNRRRFHFFNTHFAHRRQDTEARARSAALIAERLPKEGNVVLTGDFNTDAGSDPYQTLTATLRDAWRTARRTEGPEGTFHGFSGKSRQSRIDWILYRGALSPVSATTLTDNEGGRYPSDHFPVLAVFEWQ